MYTPIISTYLQKLTHQQRCNNNMDPINAPDPRFAHLRLIDILPDCTRGEYEPLFKARARAVYYFDLLFKSPLAYDLQHHLGTLRGDKARRLRTIMQLVIWSRTCGFNAGFDDGLERIHLVTTYQDMLLLGQTVETMHAGFADWYVTVKGGHVFEFDHDNIRVLTFEAAGEPGWDGEEQEY